MADRGPDEEIPGLTFRKWQKEKEKSLLLHFDIGIMPLRDDIWTLGKCGLKLLQYMAAGIPSVAHPIGAAKEIVSHGVNGLLAETADQWEEAVGALCANPDLRERMGKAAREAVEERYSLRTWGPRVAEIIDSL